MATEHLLRVAKLWHLSACYLLRQHAMLLLLWLLWWCC